MLHREERAGGSPQESRRDRTAPMPMPMPQPLQRLQSSAGNAAVAEWIRQGGARHAVQRARINDPAGSWDAHKTPGRGDGSTVLGGHGAHDQTGGAESITVPEGTTVHFYTLHGQTLSDRDGGRIERGELGPERGAETGPGEGSTRDAVLLASEEPPARRTSTHGPGDTIPDYTLYHPRGLHIHGNPVQLRRRQGPYDFRGTYVVGLRTDGPMIINQLDELGTAAPGRTVTVEEPARLSALLRPGMGDVHFAACRSVR